MVASGTKPLPGRTCSSAFRISAFSQFSWSPNWLHGKPSTARVSGNWKKGMGGKKTSLSPLRTIHSSARSPWWSCLTGWRCSPPGPPSPWTPPWRPSCHPAAWPPQTGGSWPSFLLCQLSSDCWLLTCLQSLSLQEQWEAFQIRVYDRSEGALGAIKSLIAGHTMGGLRRRSEWKVSPSRLSFSPPLTLSPATPLDSILWFPSTTIARPPTCICHLLVLWVALANVYLIHSIMEGGHTYISPVWHLLVRAFIYMRSEAEHLPNVNTRPNFKHAALNESMIINLFKPGQTYHGCQCPPTSSCNEAYSQLCTISAVGLIFHVRQCS